MKAFLVTSPKFTGSAEVVYNNDGVLCRIDTVQTDMDAQAVNLFKRAVAPHIDNLMDGFANGTMFVPTDLHISFQMWFDKYSYKVDKKRAETIWNAKSKEAHVKAFYGVEAYDRFLKRKGGKQEKMYPKTYLSSEAYETDWDKVR